MIYVPFGPLSVRMAEAFIETRGLIYRRKTSETSQWMEYIGDSRLAKGRYVFLYFFLCTTRERSFSDDRRILSDISVDTYGGVTFASVKYRALNIRYVNLRFAIYDIRTDIKT